MHKRTAARAVLSAAVVAVLGTGGVGLASLSAGSAQPTPGWKQAGTIATASTQAESDITVPEKFSLVEHDIKSRFIDVDGGGFGPGDEFIFQANLNDATDTTKVGTLHVECTFAFNVVLCEGTANLFGRGKIVIESAVPQGDHFLIAITGGTGEFANVRGQVQVKTIDDITDTLVFYLLP